MTLRILALGMVCLGCSPAKPVAVATPTPSANPAPLIAEADRLLSKSFQLDYRAPREDVRGKLRAEAAQRYAEACGLGDRRSCWLAVTYLASSAPESNSVKRAVVKNCAAGDAPSCRFMRSSANRVFDSDYAAEACKSGVGIACTHVTSEMTEAEERALHARGCEVGDPISCSLLDPSDAPPSAKTIQACERECARGYPTECRLVPQLNQLLVLAEQGCRDGFVDECKVVAYPHLWNAAAPKPSPATRKAVFLRMCTQLGLYCKDLAMLHRPAAKVAPGPFPDPVAERDALEHLCQFYRDEWQGDCAGLAWSYENNDLPPPHEGRARELREHLCSVEPSTCKKP